jgi:bleomycin hydrolase
VKANEILEAAKGGAPVEDLRKLKEKSLSDVYRFLVINLGEPPKEFEWRCKVKARKIEEGEEEEKSSWPPVAEKLTEWKSFSPQSFYREFVGLDLDEFVCLYNDPSQETEAHFRFHRARNIAGAKEMNFANIGIDKMKAVAIKSILANEPLWFAVNMGT